MISDVICIAIVFGVMVYAFLSDFGRGE